MAHKPFKQVELSKPSNAGAHTTKIDHSERPTSNHGEQGTINCSVPYAGVRRSVNCTVNPAELQRGIAKQKAAYAKSVSEHQEYRRVPKGERKVKHRLPQEESYTEDGDITLSRPSTETRRIEH